MKRNLLLQMLWLCLLLASTNYISADEQVQWKNHDLTASAGIVYTSSTMFAGNEKLRDYKGNAILLTGAYTYQKPQKLYWRLNLLYLTGKMSDNYDIVSRSEQIREWDGKVALGYTFQPRDNWLLSPFMGIGWWHYYLREKELPLSAKTKYEGPSIFIGIHISHQIKQWQIDLIANVGVPISQKRNEQYLYQGQTIRTYYQLKTRPFFEVTLPIRYLFKKWKLGISLNYSCKYIAFNSNTPPVVTKIRKQNYGGSVVATYPF